MIAIAVDDERPMLEQLSQAVKVSPDVSSVLEFTTCTEALEWVEKNPVDIAFLDISMRGMGGMALAEKLLKLRPRCKIIFCTGYSEYAVDAFQLHVSGYLMKPITAEAVQREIDHVNGERNKEKKLVIQCFGNFEVFADGEPLVFRRSKARELLAFLVDRRGSGVTARQVCTRLWEEGDDARKMNYFYQLVDDLRHSLKDAGAEDVLVKNGNTYAVDVRQLDCDYLQYLRTGRPEFRGEYMSQYSWAEETCALLFRKGSK